MGLNGSEAGETCSQSHHIFCVGVEMPFRQFVTQRYFKEGACEDEGDARRFLDAMRERFEGILADGPSGQDPLIEFGCHAAADRKKRGVGRPETFADLASPSSVANLDG